MSAAKRREGASNCHTFVVPSSVEFSASKTRLIRKAACSHPYFVKKPTGGHHHSRRALGNPY